MGNLDNILSTTSTKSLVDINNNEWQELSTEMIYNNTNKAIEGLKESIYTLSKRDFQEYFEGEDFQQWNVGNCWLLAPIDSLISFGDYEKLIRTSVKIDNKGFSIRLPLGCPESNNDGENYFVSFDEIEKRQVTINGDESILVEGKPGIIALVMAYGRLSTGKEQFDYENLRGGRSDSAFNDLIFGMKTFTMVRALETPTKLLENSFLKSLNYILENFDNNKDMIVLYVNQFEGYSDLGDEPDINHAISVENVKIKRGQLMITLSNPDDSSKSYDITFDKLIKSCGGFSFCTNRNSISGVLSRDSYKNNRVYAAAEYGKECPEKIKSVNQVVQLTGEEKELLRKARGDIVVENGSLENGYQTLIVTSYEMKRKLGQDRDYIYIYDGNNKLTIPKKSLSKVSDWRISDKYPFFLYGVKIANFISRMKHDYINTKKYDVNNNKPFCVKDGSLQFDDNSSKFDGMNRAKRKGAELFGDDYIECLNNWRSLGIDSGDNITKQLIADFLNKLVNEQK